MKPFTLALVLAALIVGLAPRPANAADCQFLLGFRLFHDLIPDIVGDCLVDQHYNQQNGDALQETTRGLLVWRKADNSTLFTDGYRTWMSGGDRIFQRLNTEQWPWESTAPAQPPAPTAVPADASIAALQAENRRLQQALAASQQSVTQLSASLAEWQNALEAWKQAADTYYAWAVQYAQLAGQRASLARPNYQMPRTWECTTQYLLSMAYTTCN